MGVVNNTEQSTQAPLAASPAEAVPEGGVEKTPPAEPKKETTAPTGESAANVPATSDTAAVELDTQAQTPADATQANSADILVVPASDGYPPAAKPSPPALDTSAELLKPPATPGNERVSPVASPARR